MTEHPHGTRLRYRAGCGCEPCREASRRDARRRGKLLRAGRPAMVPAEPARAHVRALMATGMGYPRIAEQAGLSRSTVSQLLGHGNRPLPRKVRRTSAEALLRVRATSDFVRVDATGTRRRVQALVAIGWTVRAVAAEVGLTESYLGAVIAHDVWVRRQLAVRIAEVYRRLAVLPQSGRVAEMSRRRAAVKGWVSPLAWDDNIDDPAAVPDAGPVVAGRLVDPAEVEWLRSFGTSDELIAAQLGVTVSGLRKSLWKQAAA